uniref:Uncharacterized protein n=1 Tax=viral metagenome TaxID=1070528 RepID=A0A6M3K0D1_9ZZZZ
MVDTIIEEVMRDALQAEEPGELKVNQPVPDGDKDIPSGVIQLKSAGYVWIYDTQTGDPSKVNKNMLQSKLSQKRLDGSYVFSLKQTVIPVRGTFKCLLHPDNSNRAHYDVMGLATCWKSNLTSPYQVERHMMKRHKVEYATINTEQGNKERMEDRDLQRRMIEAMAGRVQSPSIVPTEVTNPIAEETTEPEIYVSSKPYVSKKKKKKR